MKRKYAKKEDIPKGAEQFYEEKDGAWVLKLEAEDDDPPPKDKGGDPELKAKLDEFRDNNRALAKELKEAKEKFEAMQRQFANVDPEAIKRAQKMIEEASEKEEQELLKAGKLSEVVQRRLTAAIGDTKSQLAAKAEAYAKLEAQHKALAQKWQATQIQNRFASLLAARKMRPRPGAMEALEVIVGRDWHFDEADALKPRSDLLGEDGSPVKPEAYVEDHLIKRRPFLFEPAGGGGAPGNDGEDRKDGPKVMVGQGAGPLVFGKNLKDVADGKVEVRRE